MSQTKRELSPTEVRTGVVRASYAHVFEPKTPKGSTKPVYSVCLIIDKTDTETITSLRKAYTGAIELGLEKKWGGKKPAMMKPTFHDGDKERPQDPIYAGKIFINAKSDKQPGIVKKGALGQEKITNPDEFYSGCFCRAFINLYPYDTNGSRGIGVGLQHLQFVKDGERLSGRLSVEDAFNDEDGGTPEADPAGDGLPF